MNLRQTLTLTFGLSAILAAGTVASFAADLKPGDTAPDFKLQASDGKTYSLSDFKGKKAVVLAWFPKAFTPGCTAECKNFHENGGAIRKFDVAYFTASVDSVEGEKGNKKFAESLSVDFPILGDPTTETAKAYGVYNDQRKIANRWTYYIGKDGKILAVDKMVKPASSAGDVAAKLQELGIPQAK
jgi:peroxiredoxin Q/BCP